jgi:translation initiation factor IF-1
MDCQHLPALSVGEISAELPRKMPDATILAAATLVECLGPGVYRAALPNGKRIHVHLSKTLTEAAATFPLPSRVILELTPYDFDSARILRAARAGEGDPPLDTPRCDEP